MPDLTEPDDAEDGVPPPPSLMGSVTIPDDPSDGSLLSTDEEWDADP